MPPESERDDPVAIGVTWGLRRALPPTRSTVAAGQRNLNLYSRLSLD